MPSLFAETQSMLKVICLTMGAGLLPVTVKAISGRVIGHIPITSYSPMTSFAEFIVFTIAEAL
ncbi:MAG: hypothetical protein LBG48_03895 [Rickettsiales bacterium]|nr:hypothetical protein [Rickettsiales bacterium]